MRNGKKWAKAASILLVTCALTSCTMPRVFSDMMGEERYVPEGSTQTFGTPRRPILNPLHNAPRALDKEESDHSYNGPGDRAYAPAASSAPAPAAAGGIKRRVPTDNAAILSGKVAPAPATMAMTTPVTSVDEALAQKTAATAPAPVAPAASAIAATEVAPATTESTSPLMLIKPSSERPVDAAVAVEQPVAVPSAEEAPAAMMAVPVAEPAAAPADWSAPQQAAAPAEAPVEGAIKLTPPSSPKPGEEQSSAATSMPVAMAETTTPVVHTKPAVDAVASTPADAAPTSYPSLASIPDAPEAITANQIASDIKSLDAERKESLAASQQLMNDPSSTVLTSPQTGQLVSNAADAMPAMAPAAGTAAPAVEAPVTPAAPAGESTWLNNLLGPADQKAAEAKQAEEDRKAAETVAAALAEGNAQQQDLTIPPAAAAAPAMTAEQTAMTSAPSVLDQLTPAASETTAPATAAAANETAAIVAAANAEAPAAGTAPAATMDTVKLNPPVNVAEATAVKADKELTDIVEQPVEEVQALPVKKVEYLPESRYAKRRLAPVNEAY